MSDGTEGCSRTQVLAAVRQRGRRRNGPAVVELGGKWERRMGGGKAVFGRSLTIKGEQRKGTVLERRKA